MAADDVCKADRRIREFRSPEDTSGVAELLREAKEATPWSESDLNRMGELSGVTALVTLEAGRILGIVIGRRVADEAEILNLAVRPENRRQGEGRKLVQRAVEDFRSCGVGRLFLEVRESNTGAIAFYKHLGFQIVGSRKDYYQEPRESALIMELRLGKSTAGAK